MKIFGTDVLIFRENNPKNLIYLNTDKIAIVFQNQLEIILKLLKSNLENHQYQLLCILFIKAFPSNSAHLSISKELILATCNLKTESLQRYGSKFLLEKSDRFHGIF